MRHIPILAAVCALSTLATFANAVTLNPGGVIFPTGTTAAASPQTTGTVVNDNLIAYTFDPTPVTPFTNVGGNIQNRVVRNSNNDMVFMTRIRDTFNIDGGTMAILGFSLEGYGTFATDVDFRTDGLGTKGFTSVSRSVSGDLMTFRYDDPLFVDAINPPGRQETSLFPAIVTDAQHYDLTGTMTIFAEILPLGANAPSGNAQNLFTITVNNIAVPSAVPVPAAGVLMLGAIGALGAIGRRRQRKS